MLAWTPSLAIGVPWIDAQHQALFGWAERFEAAYRASDPVEHLEELFAFLAAYTLDHFAAEERFMREVGSPRLAEHVHEHGEFMRRFGALVFQWSSEGASPALLAALRGFLDLWLNEHVGTSDHRIAAFVQGREEGKTTAVASPRHGDDGVVG